LSTKLKKRHAGTLLAGLTLSIVILAALLPGWAEAQEVDTDAVSIETAPDTNNDQTNVADNRADEATTTATTSTVTTTTTSQSAYEPAAALVIEPGDSLWAIAQEQLGPEATPQQVAQETGRIYGLNRERIGEDPNLILPGQELLLTQGSESVADVSPTTAGVATKLAEVPAAEEPAAQEPATAEQPTAEQPTAADEEAVPDPAQDDESAAENDEPSYPLAYYRDRQAPGMLTVLISLGFFLGALAVATLAVAKLRRKRRLLGGPYGSSYEPSVHHGEPRHPERQADKRKRPAPDVPGSTAEVRETSDKK
jgi:hypothetical protein